MPSPVFGSMVRLSRAYWSRRESRRHSQGQDMACSTSARRQHSTRRTGRFSSRGWRGGGGLTSVFDGDGEAEAERVQECVEAAELGLAPVGQHAIQVFAI